MIITVARSGTVQQSWKIKWQNFQILGKLFLSLKYVKFYTEQEYCYCSPEDYNMSVFSDLLVAQGAGNPSQLQ